MRHNILYIFVGFSCPLSVGLQIIHRHEPHQNTRYPGQQLDCRRTLGQKFPQRSQHEPEYHQERAGLVPLDKRFQQLCGLPQTGAIDQLTWRCLCGLYALASGDGDLPAAAAAAD